MRSDKETSQITSQLTSRISTNNQFGAVDLDEWLFDKLALSAPTDVFDVGCGTGNHLIKMASRFPGGNYWGLDVSRDSIATARARAAQDGLGVRFIAGGTESLVELPDQSFDLGMSIYAFYYIDDTEGAISAMKGKLRENGRLAIMAPYKGNNAGWYDFLSGFMQVPQDVQWIGEHFMDEKVIPIGASYFQEIQRYEFRNPVVIPSVEFLRKYWASNIYHKPEYDQHFEEAATRYFESANQFVIEKKALLVIMS